MISLMSEDNQSASTRQRDLLLGVVAVRLKFVTSEQLAEATGAWAEDDGRGLGQVLAELGHLTEKNLMLLNQVVDDRVAAHGGDAETTLVTMGGDRAVHESFAASITVDDDGVRTLDVATTDEVAFGDSGEDMAARVDGDTVTVAHPDRYVIRGEYGRGAMGRVLAAFDAHVGRVVALKELLIGGGYPGSSGKATPTSPQEQAMARFLREARITGQLEHPAIVPVYEIARRADGSIFYTMKLVRGDTLGQRIKKCKSMSERLQILPQFNQICQAMAYAHSKGVIHRDLKPHNVMIGEFGETVVLDWGLAKVKGADDFQAKDIERGLELIKQAKVTDTIEGSPMGTPAYMSPEQAAGKIDRIDERSDVWGLGAMLYELLTGDIPFPGKSAQVVMLKVISEDVVPVREKEPNAPAELCAICERCLARDYESRYANAKDLAEEVGKVVVDIFGVGSFVQVREEKNVALEQMRIAEEQRALAESREREARENLSEAYYQYGLRSESENKWPEAKVYHARALVLTGRDDARVAIAREPVEPVTSVNIETFAPGAEEAVTARISPNGKYALIAQTDNNMMLWNVETGDYMHSLMGQQDEITGADFSKDGRFVLASGADWMITIWEADTASFHKSISGHKGVVTSARFSPDAKSVISASHDGTVRLWSVDEGDELMVIDAEQGAALHASLSPDGAYAVSAGGDGSVKVWRLDDGSMLYAFKGHQGPVNKACFCPKRELILSAGADKTVRIWSLKTWKPVATLSGHATSVADASFSPDSKHIVSCACAKEEHLGFCSEGEVIVWNVQTGQAIQRLNAHHSEVLAVRFLDDGKRAASAGKDKTIKVWPLKLDLFTMGPDQIEETTQKEAGLRLDGFKLVPI